MSEVVVRLRRIRAMAASTGDWRLVAEVEKEMARLGIRADDLDTTVDASVYETAAAPRKRGRPRKNPT